METEQLKVDSTDREILKQLLLNCRRSYRELAKAVGISPAALISRVQAMEKGALVLGYSATLDFVKLGYEFVALVQMSISHGALINVQEKISQLPGVAAVYDVTGEYDSVAMVMCRSRSELSALLKKILKVPNVEKTNTSMVLNVIKDLRTFDRT